MKEVCGFDLIIKAIRFKAKKKFINETEAILWY